MMLDTCGGAMENYFGEYERFEVPVKKDAGLLLGADNMVGDIYDIECELADGVHTAYMVNRFGQKPGCFNPETSRELSIMQAKGLVCKAVLSFVAFTDHPDEGHYWGEVALICYNPAYEAAFLKFITSVANRMADGVRTKVDLGEDGVEKIIASDGEWIPKQTVPMPDKSKGMAIMKSHRKLSDKLIEQGRRGNKGCYVVSWVFLLIIVALLVFALKTCMGF